MKKNGKNGKTRVKDAVKAYSQGTENTDVLGSYTGIPLNSECSILNVSSGQTYFNFSDSTAPTQDADDL